MISFKRTSHADDNITEIIDHRQHFPLGNSPIISLIERHVKLPPTNDPRFFDVLIYYSQLSQAIAVKVETETYRIGRFHEWNTMGTLYWQLNDVWAAPSWSSIEYNGNFKVIS